MVDVDLGDESFLLRLFHLAEHDSQIDLETTVKAFLGWEHEQDALARLKKAFISADDAAGNRLLWLAFLMWLRPCGFTAVSFRQLFSQLIDQLRSFVDVSVENDESIWPILRNVASALLCCTPKDAAEALLMLKICHVPVVVGSSLPK